MKYKTISVNPEAFEEYEKLCKHYEMNKGEFLETIIKYFRETKVDPRDSKQIDVKGLERKISETDKRIISFIKMQEKEILKPLQIEIEKISKELSKTDLSTKLKVINDNIVDIEEFLKR